MLKVDGSMSILRQEERERLIKPPTAKKESQNILSRIFEYFLSFLDRGMLSLILPHLFAPWLWSMVKVKSGIVVGS